MECNPPDSSFHGILQVRRLDWLAFLQGIFPTQELNWSLQYLQMCSLPLHHLGSSGIFLPKISNYQKESACAVVEAEKLQDLQSAGRRASDMVPV